MRSDGVDFDPAPLCATFVFGLLWERTLSAPCCFEMVDASFFAPDLCSLAHASLHHRHPRDDIGGAKAAGNILCRMNAGLSDLARRQ